MPDNGKKDPAGLTVRRGLSYSLFLGVECFSDFAGALAERRLDGCRHDRELGEEHLRGFTQRISDIAGGLGVRVDIEGEEIVFLFALFQHTEVGFLYLGGLGQLLAERAEHRVGALRAPGARG